MNMGFGGGGAPAYFPTEPTNLGVSLMLGVQPNLAMSMGPQAAVQLNELKKIYIGQLPRGVSDTFVEKLVKTCGNIDGFTRTRSVSGEPARYAFVEFEQVEGMLRALKVLNNKPLRDSKLLVRVDLKTENFIKEWSKLKFAEWSNQQKLLQKHLAKKAEDTGQPLNPDVLLEPTFAMWEKYILGNVQLIHDKIAELVDERNYYETNMQLYDPQVLFAHNVAVEAKFNQSEREKQRIHRIQQRAKEREKQEKDLIADWLDKEHMMHRDRDRQARRAKQLESDKKDLIHADLNYDSGPDKSERKRHPERYHRRKDERKKQRERERREDEAETKREADELAEKLRIEAELKREEEARIAKEQEFLNRPASKFVAQEAPPPPPQEQPPTPPKQEESESSSSSSESEEGPAEVFQGEVEEEEEAKEVKKGGGAVGGVEAVMRQMEAQGTKPTKLAQEMTISQIRADEEQKEKFEKMKELYKELPKERKAVYGYELDYKLLRRKDVFEKVLRPWVAKKIIEYLDEEEPTIIEMYVAKAKGKVGAEELEQDTRQFLERGQAESFVVKMFQLLIFEQMKARAQL